MTVRRARAAAAGLAGRIDGVDEAAFRASLELARTRPHLTPDDVVAALSAELEPDQLAEVHEELARRGVRIVVDGRRARCELDVDDASDVVAGEVVVSDGRPRAAGAAAPRRPSSGRATAAAAARPTRSACTSRRSAGSRCSPADEEVALAKRIEAGAAAERAPRRPQRLGRARRARLRRARAGSSVASATARRPRAS